MGAAQDTLAVLNRQQVIETALYRALQQSGLEVGKDQEGLYLVTPSETVPETREYHYLDQMAREIEREVFHDR